MGVGDLGHRHRTILRSLAFFTLAALTAAAPKADAVSLVFSDFDNTLVETRESAGGTFETKFVLFRSEQRATTLQDVPTGPKEIELTPIEFHRNLAYFAKGPGTPGALNREIKLKDGTKVMPGLYYMRNPESFKYFFSTPERNNVLEDLKDAEKRDPEGHWKAGFWDTMVQYLNHPESARWFGMITARGHDQKDWVEFFEYLKAQGYIKHLPNFRLFHNVSRAEYDQFSLSWKNSEQKKGVLQQVVQHLATVAPTESRLAPDGKHEEPMHFVTFADDNQDTLEAVLRMFQQYAQNKTVRIKFGIFNMGTQTEITATRRPQFAIIKSDGTFRHATDAEKLGEHAVLTPAPVVAEDASCSKQLLE